MPCLQEPRSAKRRKDKPGQDRERKSTVVDKQPEQFPNDRREPFPRHELRRFDRGGTCPAKSDGEQSGCKIGSSQPND